MKSIFVDGDQFSIGGVRRPIVTRTSFCLLGHYQSLDRDRARRWLDRIKAQGFDGPRVFGENSDWFPGDVYFGNPQFTTRVDAFGNHSGPFSKLQLRPGYKDMVTDFAEDLIDRDMIAEFCCIATIKGREEGWTGHGLNKFAQMFAQIFPDPRETPFLHETVNEWDAHSRIEPNDAAAYGMRWKRSSAEASHHNYPGSSIGCSAGGQWLPGMDDSNYTHRNIHPSRGKQWFLGDNGEALEDSLRRTKNSAGNRPLYLNETVHYMSQAQWDEWVVRVGKWGNLSTTDHVRLSDYAGEVLSHQVSFCFHDMNGMGTDPDLPITVGEEAMAELLGGNVVQPVNVAVPIVEIIKRGYNEILHRQPDPGGAEHFYDQVLNRGMSEARFREVLLRSDEFLSRFVP